MLLAAAACGLVVASAPAASASSASLLGSSRLGAASGATNDSAAFVSLAAYPLARCLDGSHAGFYVRKATEQSAADRWLFLLDGGGICTFKEDCINRSSTDLVSDIAFGAAACGV